MNNYKIKIYSDLKELDKVRNFVKQIALENNIDELNTYKIVLALEEVCVNIIKHSYKFDSTKRIEILAKIEQNEILFSIEDNGPSFDPRDVLPVEVDLIRKKYQKGGLGIFLISQLVDKIDYQPKNKNFPKNKLTITKILE
ncbi:MAG: ATP-binding protein [Candidatus Kapaibacteriota bacterium]|jgi:serine/threonine-protein kinase RsbW